MKTYELADLLAVLDTDVHGHTRTIAFTFGAFILHHSGIWLWLDEIKSMTNEDKKEIFEVLGFPGVAIASQPIDDKNVWGIGPKIPLMPIPFTLEQLGLFDDVSGGTITESIKPTDDQDFSAALFGTGAFEVARFLHLRKVPQVHAEATPAPVVSEQAAKPEAVAVVALVEPDKAGLVDKGWIMKKAALISKHAAQWPTANRDFQDASENGLSLAAKAPGHGEWFEAAALNWADQRGKRTSEKQQGPANSIFNLAGTKHTTED